MKVEAVSGCLPVAQLYRLSRVCNGDMPVLQREPAYARDRSWAAGGSAAAGGRRRHIVPFEPFSHE